MRSDSGHAHLLLRGEFGHLTEECSPRGCLACTKKSIATVDNQALSFVYGPPRQFWGAPIPGEKGKTRTRPMLRPLAGW